MLGILLPPRLCEDQIEGVEQVVGRYIHWVRVLSNDDSLAVVRGSRPVCKHGRRRLKESEKAGDVGKGYPKSNNKNRGVLTLFFPYFRETAVTSGRLLQLPSTLVTFSFVLDGRALLAFRLFP